MIVSNYLNISERAEKHAFYLLDHNTKPGYFKLGFRFKILNGIYLFEPLIQVEIKDYVLQPKKLVIFVDPDSINSTFNIFIDIKENDWIFTKIHLN